MSPTVKKRMIEALEKAIELTETHGLCKGQFWRAKGSDEHPELEHPELSTLNAFVGKDFVQDYCVSGFVQAAITPDDWSADQLLDVCDKELEDRIYDLIDEQFVGVPASEFTADPESLNNVMTCLSLFSWNDVPHRTIEDVRALFRACIEKLESGLA